MNGQRHQHIPPAVLDTASEWYARLSSGDASDADIERHMEWLLEAPVHADAYELVAASMQAAGAMETTARAEFAGDFASNPGRGALRKPVWGSWGWPQFATMAAAVAALLFVVIFPNTGLYDEPSEMHHYVADGTGVRTVKLADGSRVALFGGSRIAVAMTDKARSVELESGRAFFDVVSNRERPFYVRTDNSQVKVVGTRFEVLRSGSFDHVGVNEGLVSVEPLHSSPAKTAAPILLEPGVTARLDHNAETPVIVRVTAASIGAWAEGVVTFSDARLGDVVEKISALFPDQTIRLEDGVQADARFSGVLVVSSADEMAAQLANFMTLKASVSGGTIVLMPKE